MVLFGAKLSRKTNRNFIEPIGLLYKVDYLMIERAEQKLPQTSHLAEIAGLFLRLGFTAFGGPAAHIAMMRDEVVARRKWISDEG